MYIIFGILILTFIVCAHELGHFLAAKMFNIGVVEFSIGMGPIVAAKRFGETVYSIRGIPLGGFCAMYGELSQEAAGKTDPREGKPSLRRPAFKTDWARERAFTAQSKLRQVIVYLAGPFFNVVLAFLAAVILVFVPGVRMGLSVVTELSDEVHVAEEAGILPGDIILAVEDRDCYTSLDFSSYLTTHPKLKETGYRLVLTRPGEGAYSVFLKPDAETGLVGIVHGGTELDGIWGRFKGAYSAVRTMFLSCTDSLAMLIRGDASVLDMSGFVGMTDAMGSAMKSAAEEGAVSQERFTLMKTVLSLIILISVNLGIVNMLPIPALDGGRALIAWFEGMFEKTVPEKFIMLANGLSMAALLLLIAVVTLADVCRIIGWL